ncbi:MAG: thermonuclease family protein [Calditrichaeota bacterium]|nr:thermonuclease family protein [Calditrichota bacterium]MCB9391358.1 thermonuclease family protein [Calditrichota bacterium]
MRGRVQYIAGLACVLLLIVTQWTGCRHGSSTTIPPFRETRVEKSDLSVEDGDTFLWKTQRVRMLGIDCAETSSPHHHGDQEPWGSRAKRFLEEQISGARTLSIIRIEEPDRYGRWLAYLLADGENVNARVIREGLAYETVSHYGKQGLNQYAEECLAAARTAPRPEFENPAEFRKRNRKN